MKLAKHTRMMIVPLLFFCVMGCASVSTVERYEIASTVERYEIASKAHIEALSIGKSLAVSGQVSVDEAKSMKVVNAHIVAALDAAGAAILAGNEAEADTHILAARAAILELQEHY